MKEETVDFSGESPQEQLVVPSVMEGSRTIGNYKDAELADFFARPVRIYSGVWQQGIAFNQVIDPWALYFADPRVINRVTNYNLVRCKLCVKFVLSGNPFLYGQLMASYMPYPGYTSTASTTNDGRNPHGTGVPQELILASQRHKVFLTPVDSEGACMRLPFFNRDNWFQAQTGDWVDFGTIAIQTMNLLKHANGGTESISINVFAWAVDMELSIPTSAAAYGMVAQAGGDEYDGPISKPASALSKAVAKARNVPVVGPYAMATSIAANALSSVSSVLGYSRPLDLEKPVQVVPDAYRNFASTDADDRSSKLTVDSKQGVTLDTRVMGLAGEDEMGILRMAQTESYLTTFTWPVGTASDTLLFSVPVQPTLYAHWGASPSATTIAPTALAAASAPFGKWRGSIKFRFQIVCTPYHKGRLRVLYDPYVLGSLTKFNVNYTKIVDLSEVNEFEMVVSWADNKLVAQVGVPNFATTADPWSTTGIYSPSQVYDNGAITIAVMNQLTAPQDTINNDVGVNVFVRAGEDFELFDPDPTVLNNICMVPQAGWESLDSGCETLSIGHPTDADDLIKVIVGERIVSFRQLLKRYVHYISSLTPAATTSGQWRSIATYRDFPLTPGSDTSGLHTSTGLAKSVNFVSLTLLTYLGSMFVAYRGSIRYKHFVNKTKTTSLDDSIIVVFRENYTNVNALPANTNVGLTNNSVYAAGCLGFYEQSLAGAAITAKAQKQAIEVELPYVSPNRFELIRPYKSNVTYGLSHRLDVGLEPSTSAATITSWVSVGEDFNMGYFVGANLWYSNYLVA